MEGNRILNCQSVVSCIQIENGLMSDILLNSLINGKNSRAIKIVSKTLRIEDYIAIRKNMLLNMDIKLRFLNCIQTD